MSDDLRKTQKRLGVWVKIIDREGAECAEFHRSCLSRPNFYFTPRGTLERVASPLCPSFSRQKATETSPTAFL